METFTNGRVKRGPPGGEALAPPLAMAPVTEPPEDRASPTERQLPARRGHAGTGLALWASLP